MPRCRRSGFEGARERLTASFGWRYDFDTGSFGPADPIPDWLLPLRKTAGICAPCPAELVQALVIRYDPGAGTGSRRDRPVFEYVISVSLGAPATMRFRRRPVTSTFSIVNAPIRALTATGSAKRALLRRCRRP
jgi:DNA oxidative demethylase